MSDLAETRMDDLIARHPIPWSVTWYDPGQSIGHGSYTKILNARGLHVMTLGTGVADSREWQEQLAKFIVDAVNSWPVEAGDMRTVSENMQERGAKTS